MASDLRPRLIRVGQPPAPGIVHFGPGAFFRAFNAIYTHDAMAEAGGDWGIVAVSLKSEKARTQLAPQGGVYTAVERGFEGDTPSLITSVTDVMVAPEDPQAVLDVLVDPRIRIVSLTVTEKGYGHDPASGQLDFGDADIAADLNSQMAPSSVLGLLVAALGLRRAANTPPFTVLSCDNLPANGKLTRQLVVEFARHLDPELAAWIDGNVAFPSTMVDRITPATTDADREALSNRTGTRDLAAVFHEPFRQWVIEDDFPTGRPAWEKAGAQFVSNVEAHETMKLRCLNGTHSALAYLGFLAGHDTIAETIAAPGFAEFCQHLWQYEILPTVPLPEGEDLAAYTDQLLTRYRNPNIRHRTWQIAMDGSQKLPQRILAPIRENLARGGLPEGLCLVVAAWMRYVGGTDEGGHTIDVRDPLAARLKEASCSAPDSAGKVAGLLNVAEVFGSDLPQSEMFRETVLKGFQRLLDEGAGATVAGFDHTA
ncbi:MAG: mannitol dehydrogenase family protein [Pseudomonadota bacterium]